MNCLLKFAAKSIVVALFKGMKPHVIQIAVNAHKAGAGRGAGYDKRHGLAAMDDDHGIFHIHVRELNLEGAIRPGHTGTSGVIIKR